MTAKDACTSLIIAHYREFLKCAKYSEEYDAEKSKIDAQIREWEAIRNNEIKAEKSRLIGELSVI